jgi:hypothetical protein
LDILAECSRRLLERVHLYEPPCIGVVNRVCRAEQSYRGDSEFGSSLAELLSFRKS